MAVSRVRKWWRRQRFAEDVEVPTVEARGTPGATVETYEQARAYVNGAGDVFPGADYGIALSGGGIRSASFCTGVLQALAEDGSHALERADYLATVSGGGYVGVSTQMLHHAQQPPEPPENAYDQDAPEFTWLKTKHRYLGRGWQLLGGALGFVARTALNIGTIGALVFLAGFWLGVVAEHLPIPEVQLYPAILVAAVGVALRQYSLPNSPLWRKTRRLAGCEPQNFAPSPGWRHALARGGSWTGAAILVACSVAVIAARTTDLDYIVVALLVFAVIGFVLQYYRAHWVRFLGVCLLEAAWVLGAWLLALVGARWDGSVVFVAVATVVVAAFLISTDQTITSPHQLYKERLASTFGIQRSGDVVANISYDTPTILDRWGGPYDGGEKVGPTLLVCATANVNDMDVPPAGYRSAHSCSRTTTSARPNSATGRRRSSGRRSGADWARTARSRRRWRSRGRRWPRRWGRAPGCRRSAAWRCC
ncbi:MAG TPA: hypothetical protein VIW24_32480 [Aldersonia sp.]